MTRLTSSAAWLAGVLGALAATPALAADTSPPTIVHVRVTQAPEGQALTIRARIEDDSEIFAPSVYVRAKGTADFDNISMKKGVDAYEAVVPAEQVDRDLEYFIEAFDEMGNGPAREGSPEAPIVIELYDPAKGPPGGTVLATPPPSTAPPPPPGIVAPPPPPPTYVAAPPPADDDDDDGVLGAWWFWTLIGVGVTAGIAGAVIATRGSDPVEFVDIDVVGPDPTPGL